eukprot:jgi/Chrzof1/14208/Cz08g29160.t1
MQVSTSTASSRQQVDHAANLQSSTSQPSSSAADHRSAGHPSVHISSPQTKHETLFSSYALQRTSTKASKQAQEHFDTAYQNAVRKKQLFKAYLSKHQVLDTINAAMQRLFACEVLPDDPKVFIAQQLLGGSHDEDAASNVGQASEANTSNNQNESDQ